MTSRRCARVFVFLAAEALLLPLSGCMFAFWQDPNVVQAPATPALQISASASQLVAMSDAQLEIEGGNPPYSIVWLENRSGAKVEPKQTNPSSTVASLWSYHAGPVGEVEDLLRVIDASGEGVEVRLMVMPRTVKVTRLFPALGEHWNSYVNASSKSIDFLNLPEQECAESTKGFCLHAAEFERADLPSDISSCDNLRAEDSLGVFRWTCRMSGSHATIYSTGMNDNKGLKNLVDSKGWKPLALRVLRNDSTLFKSELATWWKNQIKELPEDVETDEATILNDENTVYVIAGQRQSHGLRIAKSGIAVVALEASSLKLKAGKLNCHRHDDSNAKFSCLIRAESVGRLWLEGTFIATGAVDGIQLRQVKHSTLRNVSVSDTSGPQSHNLLLIASTYNLVDGLSSSKSMGAFNNSLGVWEGSVGVGLRKDANSAGSNWNRLRRIHVSNVQGDVGLHATAPESENSYGILLVGSSNNIVSESVFAHVSIGLFPYFYSTYNVFSHIDLISNQIGIYSGSSSNSNSYNQILAVGNRTALSLTSGSAGNNFSQFVALNNVEKSLVMASAGNTFSGNILLDDKVCDIESTGNSFDKGSSCTPGPFARFALARVDHVVDLWQELNLARPFVDIDWSHMTKLFEVWGLASGDPGPCLAGSTCEFHDYRLKNVSRTGEASPVLNTSGELGSANSAFISGAACPRALDASSTVSTPNFISYFANALEISGDGIGNDNGLCEDHESCLYSPNYGAYQGEGAYSEGPTCLVDPAANMKDVKFYAYPRNGV